MCRGLKSKGNQTAKRIAKEANPNFEVLPSIQFFTHSCRESFSPILNAKMKWGKFNISPHTLKSQRGAFNHQPFPDLGARRWKLDGQQGGLIILRMQCQAQWCSTDLFYLHTKISSYFYQYILIWYLLIVIMMLYSNHNCIIFYLYLIFSFFDVTTVIKSGKFLFIWILFQFFRVGKNTCLPYKSFQKPHHPPI